MKQSYSSELQRLEEKDLNAFRLVLEKTGHPTEEEFARHLQLAVNLYRPKFNEESARGDMTMNTLILWQTLWNKENVRFHPVSASGLSPAMKIQISKRSSSAAGVSR